MTLDTVAPVPQGIAATRTTRRGVILMTIASATQTGAGLAALNYCKALLLEKWHVVVACGPPPREEGDRSIVALRQAGVEVRQLDRVVASTWPVWRQLRAIATDVKPAAVVGMMLRDRPVAMVLAKWLGVPGIVAAGNQHMFQGPLPVRLAKRWIYKVTVGRWASLVFCPSDPVLTEICAFGVPADRAVLVPNGIVVGARVRLTPELRTSLRAELGAGPDDILLLNVGRFDPQKGQDLLIGAFAKCARDRPRLRLALVGDVIGGASRTSLTAFAKDLHRRVQASGCEQQIRLAGWRSDVQLLLTASDGYVHSARWEGLSLAVLEAMASGLPVVMTDCSGTPDGFAEARNGWVVTKGNEESLGIALSRLADLRPSDRADMGARNRQLIEERYDIRVIGRRFTDLVAATVQRGRA